MFSTKCPGQDMRYWTADDVHEEKCPGCGEIIEFFKTDIRLRCRNCKTRVANPRFDMGCAEWCAHAEMCLGPGAKGIQKKSFRTVLEEEFERLGGNKPESSKALKDMINSAEDKCRRAGADMLPVVAGTVILALVKLGLVKEAGKYIDQLAEEHELPGEAVNETQKLVETALENNLAGVAEFEKNGDQPEADEIRIIGELFSEHGDKLVRPQ